MKTNVPPTTEITLTLALEEWFAILAVLNHHPHIKMMFDGVLSEYGAACYCRAGEKVAKQLAEWSKS